MQSVPWRDRITNENTLLKQNGSLKIRVMDGYLHLKTSKTSDRFLEYTCIIEEVGGVGYRK